MSRLLIGLLTIFSFTTFAADTFDTQLSNALEKSGVSKIGHRDYQEAHIVCRVPKTGTAGEPFCDVGNKNLTPTSTKFLEGGKLSKKISSLLTQAGIYPIGHRDYQEANVVCRVPKNGTSGSPLCDVENVNN